MSEHTILETGLFDVAGKFFNIDTKVKCLTGEIAGKQGMLKEVHVINGENDEDMLKYEFHVVLDGEETTRILNEKELIDIEG